LKLKTLEKLRTASLNSEFTGSYQKSVTLFDFLFFNWKFYYLIGREVGVKKMFSVTCTQQYLVHNISLWMWLYNTKQMDWERVIIYHLFIMLRVIISWYIIVL